MNTFIVSSPTFKKTFHSITELEFYFCDNPQIKEILNLLESFSPEVYSQITCHSNMNKTIYALISLDFKVEQI